MWPGAMFGKGDGLNGGGYCSGSSPARSHRSFQPYAQLPLGSAMVAMALFSWCISSWVMYQLVYKRVKCFQPQRPGWRKKVEHYQVPASGRRIFLGGRDSSGDFDSRSQKRFKVFTSSVVPSNSM